ncbi:MAG TPA: TonB-dependent receptor, partial [Acinetobacter sp.]|nr:TonB-dependent receptor [Acinetobacter sp.]
YFVLPSTSVYANIGTAFRAPSLTELYFHSEADFGPYGIYHTYGNTELKPEESISYEIGLDHQFTPSVSAYFSAYQTDVKNLIALSSSYDLPTDTTTSIYENLNKAQFTGGEVGLKWKQDDLFLSTEYAYVETENKATGLEIAYRPKQTLTLTTGLENSVYGISASLVARAKSNAANVVNPQQVPGYAVIDLNSYWNINPNVKLFTNIQNVGDSKYKTVYNFSNWYVNGGRQASVGVTLRY